MMIQIYLKDTEISDDLDGCHLRNNLKKNFN